MKFGLIFLFVIIALCLVAGVIYLIFSPVIYILSNKDSVPKKAYIFLIIAVVLGVTGFKPIMSSIISVVNNVSDDSSVSSADGFTIEGYEVILDVGLDNKVNVTENINVDFFGYGHHGIYKFTPLWLEYTGKDNKTIKRKSSISNLRAEENNYTIDNVNGKERIKIGDANKTVFGAQTYIIKYTYDMGKDPFNGFDEFIFHAFGDFWGTEIKNPKIVINLPKGLDGNKINFYSDKYRKNNISSLINYKIDGNTITIKGQDGLKLYKSLTVDIELPENYFTNGSFNYGFNSFILIMFTIGITGYIILMWSKYGRNYEKRIPTVEFYAPDNLNPAEIGYVYNKRKSSKKLTIALVINLASKGYIKIDEIKGKKKSDSQIKITNLLVPPIQVSKDDLKIPRRIITVKKLKDADDSLNQSQMTMMIHLFKKGDIKALDTNFDEFQEVRDYLVSGGYIEIISDNEKEINEKYKEELKEYEKINKEYEENLRKYEKLKESLPEIHGMEKTVYYNLFELRNEVILSEHQTFYQSFKEVSDDLNDRFKKKVYDEDAKGRKMLSRILNFISVILSLSAFFVFEDMDPSWSILYYVSFASIIVNLLFTMIMGRKTEYGEIVKAKVNGFRDFLVTAEKDKLESLVESNPHYFYDILPYTYVLNISKKWVEKFENIKMPEVDMGSFSYFDGDSALSSFYDNIYYPAPSSSSGGGSSGCSSCGGGCSSCGGGCSSCGGGGSW